MGFRGWERRRPTGLRTRAPRAAAGGTGFPLARSGPVPAAATELAARHGKAVKGRIRRDRTGQDMAGQERTGHNRTYERTRQQKAGQDMTGRGQNETVEVKTQGNTR